MDDRTLLQLRMLADKLREDPSYMSWVISAYQAQEKLTPYKLIELLNTNEEMLARLSLCKRPNTSSKSFRDQVERLSEFTAISSADIAKIIRQVESISAISAKPESTQNKHAGAPQLGLAAARDRTDEEQKNQSTKEDKDDLAE